MNAPKLEILTLLLPIKYFIKCSREGIHIKISFDQDHYSDWQVLVILCFNSKDLVSYNLGRSQFGNSQSVWLNEWHESYGIFGVLYNIQYIIFSLMFARLIPIIWKWLSYLDFLIMYVRSSIFLVNKHAPMWFSFSFWKEKVEIL